MPSYLQDKIPRVSQIGALLPSRVPNLYKLYARSRIMIYNHKVNPKSSDDLLGNSLKKLVEDNLRTLSNISDAGTQVTISSSQVASASQALAQGSTEQASAIEEITASIDEIAEKTKHSCTVEKK